MPRKPKKPCKHPGCPGLTDNNYCEEHKAVHRGDRASAASRGYDAKWRRARSRYLKAHPLCVKCRAEGRLTRATVVDHVIPHRGDPVLLWDESNWQALCKQCHDKKTWNKDRLVKYKYEF